MLLSVDGALAASVTHILYISEKIFDKTVNSSFKGAGLLEYLVEKNVHTVAVVGLQTD